MLPPASTLACHQPVHVLWLRTSETTLPRHQAASKGRMARMPLVAAPSAAATCRATYDSFRGHQNQPATSTGRLKQASGSATANHCTNCCCHLSGKAPRSPMTPKPPCHITMLPAAAATDKGKSIGCAMHNTHVSTTKTSTTKPYTPVIQGTLHIQLPAPPPSPTTPLGTFAAIS